jgi:hypothetical protein
MARYFAHARSCLGALDVGRFGFTQRLLRLVAARPGLTARGRRRRLGGRRCPADRIAERLAPGR